MFLLGIVSPILAEAPKRATKFAVNEFFKEQLADENGQLTTTKSAISGAMAGFTESLGNCPFEVVKGMFAFY